MSGVESGVGTATDALSLSKFVGRSKGKEEAFGARLRPGSFHGAACDLPLLQFNNILNQTDSRDGADYAYTTG